VNVKKDKQGRRSEGAVAGVDPQRRELLRMALAGSVMGGFGLPAGVGLAQQQPVPRGSDVLFVDGFEPPPPGHSGTWQRLSVAAHARKVITENIATGTTFDPTIAETIDARAPTMVSAIPYRSFCRPVMGEPGVLYYAGSLHSNYPGNEIDRIDLRDLSSATITTTLNHQPRVPPQGVDSGYGSGSGDYVYRQYGTPLPSGERSQWQPYAHHVWTKNSWHPTWGWVTQITYAEGEGQTVGANPLGAGTAYQQSSLQWGVVSYDYAEARYRVRVPKALQPNFATTSPGPSGLSDWNPHRMSILALLNAGGITYVSELVNNDTSRTDAFSFNQATLSGTLWGWADGASGNGVQIKWLEGSRYLGIRADFNRNVADPDTAFTTCFLINLADSTKARRLQLPAGPLAGAVLNGNGNVAFAVDRNARRIFWMVFEARTVSGATQFVRFYRSTFDDPMTWTELSTTGFPTITHTSFQSGWLASNREPMHYYNGHLFVMLPEGGGADSPGYVNGAADWWRCKVDGGEALPATTFNRFDYWAQSPATNGFRFSNTSVANLQMIGTKHVNWAYNPANATYYQCAGDFGFSFCASMCTLAFDATPRGYTFTELLTETQRPATGKFRPSSPDDGHWFHVPANSAWVAGRGKFVFLRGGDGTGMFGNVVLRAFYGATSEAGTGAQVATAVADGWSLVEKFLVFDPAVPDGFTNPGPSFTHNAGSNTFSISSYNGWTQDNGGTFFPDVWTAPSSATRNGAFDPVTGHVWRFYPSFLARFDMVNRTVRLYNISQWVSPDTSRAYTMDGAQPASAAEVMADGPRAAFGWFDAPNNRWKTYGAFEWEHKATWLDAATGFLYVVSPATGYLWRFDTRATLSPHVANDGWRMTFGPIGERIPLVGCYPTLDSLRTWPPVVFNGDPKMNALLLPWKGGLLWLSPGHHDHGASGEPHYAFWRRLGYTGPWSVMTMPQEFAANAGAARAPYSIDNDELMLISQAFTDVETRQFYRYFWKLT
jgi:hypothetical protein